MNKHRSFTIGYFTGGRINLISYISNKDETRILFFDINKCILHINQCGDNIPKTVSPEQPNMFVVTRIAEPDPRFCIRIRIRIDYKVFLPVYVKEIGNPRESLR